MEMYRDRAMNSNSYSNLPSTPTAAPESPIFALLGGNDALVDNIITELSVMKERLYPVLQPEPPAVASGSCGQPMPPERLVLSRLEMHNRSLGFILSQLQDLRGRLSL